MNNRKIAIDESWTYSVNRFIDLVMMTSGIIGSITLLSYFLVGIILK